MFPFMFLIIHSFISPSVHSSTFHPLHLPNLFLYSSIPPFFHVFIFFYPFINQLSKAPCLHYSVIPYRHSFILLSLPLPLTHLYPHSSLSHSTSSATHSSIIPVSFTLLCILCSILLSSTLIHQDILSSMYSPGPPTLLVSFYRSFPVLSSLHCSLSV